MKRKFEDNFEESDGESWHRGPLLGKGGFGSVYLAELKNPNSSNSCFPELMAVKSAEVSAASSLQKEKQVLHDMRGCPYILNCYGEETTTAKNGHMMIYNLLLEYASGGTLSSVIKRSGGSGLPELDVKRYTRCLLRGIDYIHRSGYVHCDLKPDNVLLVSDENWESFVPKIGDFGLAKKSVKSKNMELDRHVVGTSLYLAPESVIDGIQETPSDIWALGCIVYEMLTGKKAWDPKPGMTTDELFEKIRDPCEVPKIPANMSKEAKEFLNVCLVRNPFFRYSARMLLIQDFVRGSSDGGIGRSLGEGSVDFDDDYDFSSSSSSSSDDWSFTYLKGIACPFHTRADDGVNTKRRMLDNNLQLNNPKPGVVV
ncbi:mitogen-activated protein kinase kinase kinase 20 [Euphorbia peplus]|nr:mitogen-activated protein kinase kinase kinase 20 [Euphorbia peplus]